MQYRLLPESPGVSLVSSSSKKEVNYCKTCQRRICFSGMFEYLPNTSSHSLFQYFLGHTSSEANQLGRGSTNPKCRSPLDSRSTKLRYFLHSILFLSLSSAHIKLTFSSSFFFFFSLSFFYFSSVFLDRIFHSCL